MNKFFLLKMAIFTIVLSLCLVSNIYAEGEIVTSETLSIDDVKENFMDYHFTVDPDERWIPTEIEKGSLKIHGIYQEGNKATVYLTFVVNHKVQSKKCSFIRFNSGKWYIVPEGDFLRK